METKKKTSATSAASRADRIHENQIADMRHQIERFSEICAAILSITDMDDFFQKISETVVEVSDFSRVLISYFTNEPPFRKIIGYRGIDKATADRLEKIEMPRSKYQDFFKQGIRIGSQSCYIPHTRKEILVREAVIFGEKDYPEENGAWHKDDNLLIAMKDRKGRKIGIISVDESKSGRVPTAETVRPLEIFANLISESIQKKMLETRIEESEEKYRDLLGNIMLGVIRAAPDGRLLEANPAAVRMFGFKGPNSFLRTQSTELFETAGDCGTLIGRLEKSGAVRSTEHTMVRRGGQPFWASISAKAVRDGKGRIQHFDAVIEDITERKRLEQEVHRLSITDELTGLYNRRYFNRNLPREIELCEKWSSSLSLIMIDIDDFKIYNDTYHHLQGDEVIKEIARVIQGNIRKGRDWGSRFGGDEFMIVLPGTDAAKAAKVAERIRAAFHEKNFRPRGEVVNKSISLGVAGCCYAPAGSGCKIKLARTQPLHPVTVATELIRLADKALYRAKRKGKNLLVTAHPSIEPDRSSRNAPPSAAQA